MLEWALKGALVTLSIGKPNVQIDLMTTNKPRTNPYLGPIGKPCGCNRCRRSLFLRPMRTRCWPQRADFRPDRIGIVGHSFGGKWAMFPSCLYDKFAAAVWSGPRHRFWRARPSQNPNGSVNYWDVWHLGFDLSAIADPQNAGPFRNKR